MKSAVATFLATILLVTGVAHAKPSKSKQPAGLRCKLTDVQYWDAPSLDDIEYMVAFRLSCRNSSKAPARVKAHDVVLIDNEGDKYGPDRVSDNLDTIYQDEANPPEFVDRFIEIAPGATVDIGFTFSGDDGLTDDHLILDVDGVKYAHTRESSASDDTDG